MVTLEVLKSKEFGNSSSIQNERIRRLNDSPTAHGEYVLYWMQQSQRVHFNHALEYAIQRANDLGQPLLVVFALTSGYPEANERHYRFMLEGLAGVSDSLQGRGIGFKVSYGHPPLVTLENASRASLVVCDRGYLRHQKKWRNQVSRMAESEVVEVETDVVVPVETASDKAEIGARTLRPRIHRNLSKYLVGLRSTSLKKDSSKLGAGGISLDDIGSVLGRLKLDKSVLPVDLFRGGTSQAKRVFRRFKRNFLEGYEMNRNRPETDYVSYMGMYLHFGQISPLYLALDILQADNKSAGDREAFIEELVVRRELACNFVNFTPDYDRFTCLPQWASASLRSHKGDGRRYSYSRAQLEAARTHDPYWNAAMLEMKHTGYMHNYMRMYWGKKILEWSSSPQVAWRRALYLNNKYFIDGRDPNSYAGVAWVFGLHDRAWPDREIFGKVRIMTASGLERKADPRAYVDKVKRMIKK
jgi:deoxyribodipyrimidine photo-lyase